MNQALALLIPIGWLATVPALVLLRWRVARPLKARTDRCACGYSRIGLAPSTPCPECGVGPERRPGGSCECGYSLEGIREDAPCPECGAAPFTTGASPAATGFGRAWGIAGAMFFAAHVLYFIALAIMSIAFAPKDFGPLIFAPIFFAPAAAVSALLAIVPNARRRGLQLGHTILIASVTEIAALLGAGVLVWEDFVDPTEVEYLGLLFVSIPGVAAAGGAGLLLAVILTLGEQRRERRERDA